MRHNLSRTDDEFAVMADGVSVTLGGRSVLSDIEISAEAGTVTALLGPNGAGKTTLVECLEGYRRPDYGTIRVLGTDPWRAPASWRADIGVVHQECRIDADLSVTEYLRMIARCHPSPMEVGAVLDLLALGPVARRPVHHLSGGERRRLDIALALVGRPRLLFLDEPTTAFDPAGRHELWAVLRQLAGAGVTMVLTSHFLDEVEALADSVVLLVQGTARACGTPDSLPRGLELPWTVTFLTRGPAPHGDELLPEGARPYESVTRDHSTGRLCVRTHDPDAFTAALRELPATELDAYDITVRPPTLEDVYLHLTGEQAMRGTM